MRYYTILKRGITTLVILYFLIGNITWATWDLEIFPFYSWDLFSYIPNLSTDYGLKINAIDGTYLDQPIYFQDAKDIFNDTESIIAFNVIQTLGEAIETEGLEKAEELRVQIEDMYLIDVDRVEYEIKKRTYYAGELWRTGRYESETRLATYDTAIR